jgi:hypothetical protein
MSDHVIATYYTCRERVSTRVEHLTVAPMDDLQEVLMNVWGRGQCGPVSTREVEQHMLHHNMS